MTGVWQNTRGMLVVTVCESLKDNLQCEDSVLCLRVSMQCQYAMNNKDVRYGSDWIISLRSSSLHLRAAGAFRLLRTSNIRLRQVH